MQKPVKPIDEDARLEAVYRYQILDTLAEKAYDDITKVAALVCGAEISVISLIDKDRQWFKSTYGIEVQETERDLAFCAHAILQDETMMVPDASKDPRFNRIPYVMDEPKIRFYAGAPVRSGDGKNLGTLCVMDRKPRQLEDYQGAALEALSRQVTHLLELRLHLKKLTEMTQEMEMAKENALRLARVKSEFLSTMSHEIRTPLNGVIGMAELLSGTELSPVQSQYTDAISISAQNLLEIINDVLDASKIEAGMLKIDMIEFDLKKMMQDLQTVFQFLASSKKINFQVQQLANSLDLVGDSKRIRQILVNLISNALKFTRQGEVKVIVKTAELFPDLIDLEFEVSDTGIGIPEKFMPYLFHSFTQQDISTTRNFGGTGLGLSITKQLIDLMGGQISVDSQESKGSNFRVQLRLQRPQPLSP